MSTYKHGQSVRNRRRWSGDLNYSGATFLGLFLLFTAPHVLAVDVIVEALFPKLAVLRIDGARATLKQGETTRGVSLISSDAQKAVIEVNGERQELRVSQRISSAFSAPQKRTVTIPRSAQMQYRTTAEINGRRVDVLVDTGANIVAMSRLHARALGIDPSQGTPILVTTAGSQETARQLVLSSIDVGGIRVNSVAATVIDSDFPEDVLLGMSFLQHVDLDEKNGVMTLQARF
ncbi:MAG: TIGR02281 family clan AA aspartic protease [Pseudomonadota bacterium]